MNLYIKNHTIYSGKINKDLVVLLMSDLHINKKIDLSIFDYLIEEITKTKPDIICMAGDLGEDASIFGDKTLYQKIINFLRSISKIAPIYMVRGNHDSLLMYEGKWKNFSSSHFFQEFNNIPNVHALFNKTINVGFNNVNISMVDLGEDYYNYYVKGHESIDDYFMYVLPKIKELENNLNIDDYNILLIHSPINVFNREFRKYSLVLTGHMHNGGIPVFLDKILPGNFGFIYPSSKLKFFPDYARGVVDLEGECKGIVSPPITMSAKLENNKLIKKLYKPGIFYVNIKSRH